MKRLGVIVPSSNSTVEKEFSIALQQAEFTAHYSRVHLENVTLKALQDMENGLSDAAALLSDVAVDAVLFACTSGSLVKGLGYDLVLSKKIQQAAKCPSVTTSTAVVEALRSLGAKKVSLATPYITEVTKREVGFLEQNGFTVVKEESLGAADNLEIGRLTAKDAADLARKVDCPDADAVFVSCTNLQTFEVLQGLEAELGKAVVSSNSASLWFSQKALKVKPADGLSKLFKL